jgi:hypothetical protein
MTSRRSNRIPTSFNVQERPPALYLRPLKPASPGHRLLFRRSLRKGVADANTLWDEVPKLNKIMTDASVPYFTVNPNTVGPPAGGRGN